MVRLVSRSRRSLVFPDPSSAAAFLLSDSNCNFKSFQEHLAVELLVVLAATQLAAYPEHDMRRRELGHGQ
jgi:hypothetical protein